MKVTERYSRGKFHNENSITTRKLTRPVVEYLVLDVRTWVKDRPPKIVQEVFEGQEFLIKRDETMLRETTAKGNPAGKATDTDNSATAPAT
jgi:hypothetical protein